MNTTTKTIIFATLLATSVLSSPTSFDPSGIQTFEKRNDVCAHETWSYFASWDDQRVSPNCPFEIVSETCVALKITDCWCYGEQWSVTVDNEFVGDTSLPSDPEGRCASDPWTSDAQTCFDQHYWSSFEIVLQPGNHTFELEYIPGLNPTAGTGAYWKYEEVECPPHWEAIPGTVATDLWCQDNCTHDPAFCPESLCRMSNQVEEENDCTVENGHVTSSTHSYKGTSPVYDDWCQAVCNQPLENQYCPENFCECGA